MSDMKKFHARLWAASQNEGAYFQALTAITKASSSQMKAISSDLSWQNWGEQEPGSATRIA